jgi:biotin carboxylase
VRIAILHHPKSFFPLDVFQRVHEVAELIWVVDSSQWAPAGAGGDRTAANDRWSGPKGSTGPAPPDEHGDRRLLRRLGPVVDIAGLDRAEATRRLAAERPDGVISFVDHHIELAADFADRLGLPFHSPQVATLMVDKLRQREALAREGIPQARFWAVPRGLDRAGTAAFAAGVDYPAVLKPVRGSGSLDIQRVTSPEQLVAALLADRTGRDWLVDEYIPDTLGSREDWYANYLSVESVVSRGEISHVGFCGRFPLSEPFRESGNFMPGLVEPGSEAGLTRLVEEAVRALGIRDSVLHTEIKLTADGPRLIEVNGRLGGRPPFVLETVSSTNLFAVTCQVAGGVPVKFEQPVATSGVGFWLMLHGPISASRVVDVEGLERLASLDGVEIVRVNRGPGAPLDWRAGTDAHVLVVRGRTATHCHLGKLVDDIRRTTVMTFE